MKPGKEAALNRYPVNSVRRATLARGGPPHRTEFVSKRSARRHIDRRIQGAVSLRRFAGTELKMQGGSPTDSGGHFKGRVGQRKA